MIIYNQFISTHRSHFAPAVPNRRTVPKLHQRGDMCLLFHTLYHTIYYPPFGTHSTCCTTGHHIKSANSSNYMTWKKDGIFPLVIILIDHPTLLLYYAVTRILHYISTLHPTPMFYRLQIPKKCRDKRHYSNQSLYSHFSFDATTLMSLSPFLLFFTNNVPNRIN